MGLGEVTGDASPDYQAELEQLIQVDQDVMEEQWLQYRECLREVDVSILRGSWRRGCECLCRVVT